MRALIFTIALMKGRSVSRLFKVVKAEIKRIGIMKNRIIKNTTT